MTATAHRTRKENPSIQQKSFRWWNGKIAKVFFCHYYRESGERLSPIQRDHFTNNSKECVLTFVFIWLLNCTLVIEAQEIRTRKSIRSAFNRKHTHHTHICVCWSSNVVAPMPIVIGASFGCPPMLSMRLWTPHRKNHKKFSILYVRPSPQRCLSTNVCYLITGLSG